MKTPARLLLLFMVTGTGTLAEAVAGEITMTFDPLPTNGIYASYSENGLTFAPGGLDRVRPGVSNVFLTVLNPQNSTTAVQIDSSNTFSYRIWMGGRLFSLRSLNLVEPVAGRAVIDCGFATMVITNGRSGLVTFSSKFEHVAHVQFNLFNPLISTNVRLRFDDITVEPSELASFINWETPPIHPVAMSSDGRRLAVCNLPDNRLELFDITTGIPAPIGSVPVGLDPVTVRWRTTNEIWVVNHISDSISVVDLAAQTVVATINTMDTPADVVFAGTPTRAFVSCAMPNVVQVFDPLTRTLAGQVSIDGERPKAMAVSPNGNQVYVAIFESGNASTTLGQAIHRAGAGANVVDHPSGPYGGRNPPPNRGNEFSPAINPAIDVPLPKVTGHIVKKNTAGRWMDDNNSDWTEFVSGTNASVSGRRTGWDMPDRDLAVIDATGLTVSYATRLMNICMDVAVNPASGQIAVIGTDGLNEVRFEPNLNGTFLRVQLALVDPATMNKTVKDLNPHLDYLTRTLPEPERLKSLGDPRGIVWNSSGTRAYVTGMGSGNLVVIDSSGERVRAQPIALQEGPTGIALDEMRQRLYVLNRFSASISVVDVDSHAVVATVPLFDPTPQVIKTGRKHLYDTHKTSGLGHAACASCHVDARMDRLAWDLGDPTGNVATNGRRFHPMKGPMVTMTFQDMVRHEPFHWRGDRKNLEEFMPTFTNLQAAASGVSSNEITELTDFLATIHFPPNPFREFDNSFSTNIALPGHRAIGRGALPTGAQLPNGNAFAGMTNVTRDITGGCLECHSLPSGLKLSLVSAGRLGQTFLKPAQLRNVYEKTGLDFDSTESRAGFGFTHSGNGDTLTRFLQQGFAFIHEDQRTADFIAFLLSFSGSDLPLGTGGLQNPVGVPSKDVPAGVGKQITVTSIGPIPRLDQMLALANSPTSRVELIVKGRKDGLSRGWFYVRGMALFQSDRNAETLSPEALRGFANSGNELTYTIVPQGTGRRFGLDRDMDGFLDRDELDFPSDPANPASMPLHTYARISMDASLVTVSWNSVSGRTYQVQFNNSLGNPAWSNLQSSIVASNGAAALSDNLSEVQRNYRIQILK